MSLRNGMTITDYFNTCVKCKYQLPKTPEYFKKEAIECIKCQKNELHDFHIKDEQKKSYLRNRMKKNVNDLSDEYVINLIVGKRKGDKKFKENISKNKDLIELQRHKVSLERSIKKWNNTKNI